MPSRLAVIILSRNEEKNIGAAIDSASFAEEILVVDYKTNRPAPQDSKDVAPAYLRQMAAYRALLQQIYPGRPVRCALLWTDIPRLMPLEAALLDRAFPS